MKRNLLIMLLAASAVLAQNPPPPPGGPGGGGQGPAPKPKVVVNSPAWSQKVESAAKDPTQIKALMADLSPEQYADFASAVIKAIETLPQDPDLVVANRIASAAKELISATPGQGRTEVVAVIFAVAEVAYLPAVAENLAASFSKSANNLDDAGYQMVAKEIIGAVAEKTATTDNGTARLAIVVSVFQSGGNLTQSQTQTLVAQACPAVQESTRETVVTVANQIASTGSYTGVANLTGVTLSITPTTQQQIDQRQQTTQTQQTQQQTQPQQQGQQQQQTTDQQTQTQQQGQTTTTPDQTTPPPAESNNIGAPGLSPPVSTPGSDTEGLLGAIGNRGTDPIGNIVSGGTGGASGSPDQGGGSQGGSSTGGGDVVPPPLPPPPPPPPPPKPYQGQS